jgi:hypothetical protein
LSRAALDRRETAGEENHRRQGLPANWAPSGTPAAHMWPRADPLCLAARDSNDLSSAEIISRVAVERSGLLATLSVMLACGQALVRTL